MPEKHSSLSLYFALVFAISIPFWVLGAIEPIQLLPGLPLSAVGALAPGLAACILVYRRGRFSEILRLLKRSFDFAQIKSKPGLLAAILINPAIALIAYAGIKASNPSLPGMAPLTLAVLPMFAFFFIGALGEELGWSGFATGPLLQRGGTIAAGLILGSIWAIWHFVPLLQAGRSPAWIAWWSLGTLSLRIIIVWLYAHAGPSVFMAALFHAMINLCWQLFPVSGSYYDPRVFGLITAGLAFIALASEPLFLRRNTRPA